MKVRIDEEMCSGDEICVEMCPELFEMKDDVAVVKMESVPMNLKINAVKLPTSVLPRQ